MNLILLAGGRGARAGAPKGLLRVDGEFWLERQLADFARVGGQSVTVVLGFGSEEYLAGMPWLWERRRHGMALRAAVNPAPERGPFSSLQTGLREGEAAFVLPVDIPVPARPTWEKIAAQTVGMSVVVPLFEGRGGHPVWISSDFARELLARPVDSRLDTEIRSLRSSRVARVETADPAVRINLNSPEDWRGFLLPDPVELAGAQAALLSAVEVGLGSLLHALHVPFRGQLLSLNQIFLLARALRLGSGSRTLPLTVSNVAATLKSLSPAGKRLGPMAAISAQGGLFTLGALTLGPNVVGAALGAMLAALWAFLQPLVSYALIFGSELVPMAEFYLQRVRENFPVTSEGLWIFLGVVVALKLTLALVAVGLAYRLSEASVARYFTRLIGVGRARRRRMAERQMRSSPSESRAMEGSLFGAGGKAVADTRSKDFAKNARGALGDLLNPLFLCSFALMATFVLLSESTHGRAVWILLRPLALGFVIFFLLRVVPLEGLADRLSRYPRFARALRVALASLREL